MELNGIVASLPLIAAIVGVTSGTITVLRYVLRGYRHVRQRAKQAAQPRVRERRPDSLPTTGQSRLRPRQGSEHLISGCGSL